MLIFSFDVLMFIILSPITRSIRVWDFVVEIKLLLMESLTDANQPSSIDGKPYWCQPAIINWWKALLMQTCHHQLMGSLIDANQPSPIDGKPFWCQPAIINCQGAYTVLISVSYHMLFLRFGSCYDYITKYYEVGVSATEQEQFPIGIEASLSQPPIIPLYKFLQTKIFFSFSFFPFPSSSVMIFYLENKTLIFFIQKN